MDDIIMEHVKIIVISVIAGTGIVLGSLWGFNLGWWIGSKIWG